MDCQTCSEHQDTVVGMKSYKLLVKVFGTLISLLLVTLLTIVGSSKLVLKDYKIEALNRSLQTQQQLSEVNTALKVIENDISYTKDGIADIKRLLKADKVFAGNPIDNSTLRVRDYEQIY